MEYSRYGAKKYVTAKNLTKGQKIFGTKTNDSLNFFTGYVKEINCAYVILNKWKPDGEEEKIDSNLMFEVYMPDEEFEKKYAEGAVKVLIDIQNTLSYDEIGYHEMWNGWLYGNPFEIAKDCEHEKIHILGHCSYIQPKYIGYNLSETLDIGVCAEYEDGERFWCHYSSAHMKEMIKTYGKRIQGIKK